MTIINTEQFAMPSDPATIKQIKDACLQISGYKLSIEGSRGNIKQAIDDLHEETEIPKKHLRKIANLYHNSNKQAVEAESEATIALYEHVFPESRPTEPSDE